MSQLSILIGLAVIWCDSGFAKQQFGISSIALPGISERSSEMGLFFGSSETFNTTIIDEFSAKILYFPSLKLMPPPRVVIQGDTPVAEEGNSLDFIDSHASLVVLSPELYTCAFRRSLCLGAAPLTFAVFSSSSQVRAHVSPKVMAKVQSKNWFASYTFDLFYEESLAGVGYAL